MSSIDVGHVFLPIRTYHQASVCVRYIRQFGTLKGVHTFEQVMGVAQWLEH